MSSLNPPAQCRRPARGRRPVAAVAAAILATAALVGTPTPAIAGNTLLSTDRPTTASTVQSDATPAGAAVDGDPTTRWSSKAGDPQWIRVDLGGQAHISSVVLQWENAYATAFSIDVSADGTTWKSIYSTTTGQGGRQSLPTDETGRYVRMLGTARHTSYGYSLWEFQVYGALTSTPPATAYVPANPPVTGVTPSHARPVPHGFHEFQANCAFSHVAMNDPIVFPNKPGVSHMHSFFGNVSTDASSTLSSLQAAGTTCTAPGDKSAYWVPTLYQGNREVEPIGPQIIYYKSAVRDYTSVRPFPLGLRFVVGNPGATAFDFHNAAIGWSCGSSAHNADFPASCPAGSRLLIRYQAPSCWDGVHLDTPDHKSHMVYPVDGVCTTAHPVALPMLEVKIAYPISGNLSTLHLASGRGYSFHYDFYNAWDPATQAALVHHCINGALQCDARGYDNSNPSAGAALTRHYRLP